MTEHAFSLKIDVLFPPPQEAFPATSIDCSDKHHAYAVIALRGGGSSPLLAGPAAPRGVGSPGFVFSLQPRRGGRSREVILHLRALSS